MSRQHAHLPQLQDADFACKLLSQRYTGVERLQNRTTERTVEYRANMRIIGEEISEFALGLVKLRLTHLEEEEVL